MLSKVEEFCIRFHMMKPCSTVVKNVAGEVGENFEERWDIAWSIHLRKNDRAAAY